MATHVGVEQNERLLGGLQPFERVDDMCVLFLRRAGEFLQWRIDDMFNLGIDRPAASVQRIGEYCQPG